MRHLRFGSVPGGHRSSLPRADAPTSLADAVTGAVATGENRGVAVARLAGRGTYGQRPIDAGTRRCLDDYCYGRIDARGLAHGLSAFDGRGSVDGFSHSGSGFDKDDSGDECGSVDVADHLEESRRDLANVGALLQALSDDLVRDED